jgi:hypothetical protein
MNQEERLMDSKYRKLPDIQEISNEKDVIKVIYNNPQQLADRGYIQGLVEAVGSKLSIPPEDTAMGLDEVAKTFVEELTGQEPYEETELLRKGEKAHIEGQKNAEILARKLL